MYRDSILSARSLPSDTESPSPRASSFVLLARRAASHSSSVPRKARRVPSQVARAHRPARRAASHSSSVLRKFDRRYRRKLIPQDSFARLRLLRRRLSLIGPRPFQRQQHQRFRKRLRLTAPPSRWNVLTGRKVRALHPGCRYHHALPPRSVRTQKGDENHVSQTSNDPPFIATSDLDRYFILAQTHNLSRRTWSPVITSTFRLLL